MRKEKRYRYCRLILEKMNVGHLVGNEIFCSVIISAPSPPWIILTFLQMKCSMSFILDMTELNKRTGYFLGFLLWTYSLDFSKMVFMPLIYFSPFPVLSCSRKKKILLLPKLLKSLLLPPTSSCALSCMRGHKDVCPLPCIICKNRVMQVLQGFSWRWSESWKKYYFLHVFFCVS